jgi:hypothetical protein
MKSKKRKSKTKKKKIKEKLIEKDKEEPIFGQQLNRIKYFKHHELNEHL